MWYTVGIAAALLAFQALPAATPAAVQWFTVFMIGFFLYGPQMLIGLCGAELVGPDSVGASEGFLGWIAYLGAANAGGSGFWGLNKNSSLQHMGTRVPMCCKPAM